MATVVECSGGAKYRRAWAVVDEAGEMVSVTVSFRHAIDAACCYMSGGWGIS
jgi:hypothetical protein